MNPSRNHSGVGDASGGVRRGGVGGGAAGAVAGGAGGAAAAAASPPSEELWRDLVSFRDRRGGGGSGSGAGTAAHHSPTPSLSGGGGTSWTAHAPAESAWTAGAAPPGGPYAAFWDDGTAHCGYRRHVPAPAPAPAFSSSPVLAAVLSGLPASDVRAALAVELAAVARAQALGAGCPAPFWQRPPSQRGRAASAPAVPPGAGPPPPAPGTLTPTARGASAPASAAPLPPAVDGQGRTALHAACQGPTLDPDVVGALLGAYPEAVAVRDDGGMTPLDRLLLPPSPPSPSRGGQRPSRHSHPRPRRDDADVAAAARMLLRAEAGLGVRRTLDGPGAGPGPTPLHLACRSGASAEVASLLLRAFPGSASARDRRTGETPLHAAVRCGAGAAVVRALVQADASRAAERDSGGRTPLSAALADGSGGGGGGGGGASEEVLLTLIAAFPLAASLPEPDGVTTPLVRAIRAGRPVSVIRELLRAHPRAASWVADDRGRTPLRLAAELSEEGTVLALLEADPSVVSVPDAAGETPLLSAVLRGRRRREAQDEERRQLALMTPAAARRGGGGDAAAPAPPPPLSARAVEALLRADPDRAAAVDAEGRTPLHVACEDAMDDVVLAILRYCPEAAGVRSRRSGVGCGVASAKGAAAAGQSVTPLWTALDRKAPRRRGGGGAIGGPPGNNNNNNNQNNGADGGNNNGGPADGRAPLSIVRALAAADPTQVLECDADGNTVLHRLVLRSSARSRYGNNQDGDDDDDVFFEDDVFFLGRRVWGGAGTGGRRAGFYEDRVIRILLDACPEAAARRNARNGHTPLHSACLGSGAGGGGGGGGRLVSSALLEALLRAGPAQLFAPDDAGRTPAYYAYRTIHGMVLKRLRGQGLVPDLSPHCRTPQARRIRAERARALRAKASAKAKGGDGDGEASGNGDAAMSLAVLNEALGEVEVGADADADADADAVAAAVPEGNAGGTNTPNALFLRDINGEVRAVATLLLQAETMGGIPDASKKGGGALWDEWNMVSATAESRYCPDSVLALALRCRPLDAFRDRYLVHRLAAASDARASGGAAARDGGGAAATADGGWGGDPRMEYYRCDRCGALDVGDRPARRYGLLGVAAAVDAAADGFGEEDDDMLLGEDGDGPLQLPPLLAAMAAAAAGGGGDGDGGNNGNGNGGPAAAAQGQGQVQVQAHHPHPPHHHHHPGHHGPLHHFRHGHNHRVLCPRCFRGGPTGADYEFVRQDLSGSALTTLMKELVKLDPSLAALPDPTRGGRLPLNIAIESGRTWYEGVRELFHAAPRVLQVRDVGSGIYPFMLSATLGSVADDDDEEMEEEDSKPSASENPQGCSDEACTEDRKVGVAGAAAAATSTVALRIVKRPRLTMASSNSNSGSGNNGTRRQQREARRQRTELEKMELRRLTTVFHLLTLDPTLVKGGIVEGIC